MVEKMTRKYIGASISKGICPSCGRRLLCKSLDCGWSNVYVKRGGSSSGPNKPKPNNAIIIDMTAKERSRYETGICYACDHEKYPGGKVIDPTVDKYAQQRSDGSWVCGVCIAEQNNKLLSLFGGGGQKK